MPDYPAPEWSLTAILRGPSAVDVVSIASGSSHILAIPATQTSELEAGEYAVALRVTDGTDVFEIERGSVVVEADIVSLEAGHDARSQAKRSLENINAVLEARASIDQQSYTINGRSLQRTSIAELLQLKKHFEKAVASEGRGGKARRILGRRVSVEFGR